MDIVLAARDAEIVLHSGPTGHARATLIVEETVIHLGGDVLSVLVPRLLHCLGDRLAGPVLGHVEGVPVLAVAHLVDPHASIYAADHGGLRVLYVQAADLSILARIELDAAARHRWARALTRRGPT